MKVAMICPYSMSRPGGVQGQVLGLARELRRLDVDVRIVAPCDGPPPDATIVSVGPTVEWESNGSIAPIAPGRATARRTAEALRSLEPDVVHLHEPVVPGPTVSALIGFNGPDGRHVPRRGRGPVPVAAARAAFADDAAHVPRRGLGVGARDRVGQLDGRRVHGAVERDRDRPHRVGRARRAPTTDGVVHRPARTPQGSRGLARRVGGHRPRRHAADRRRRPADRRAPPARRRATSSGSAPSPTRRATRCCAARPRSARRRCAASRSASCCSRRWPRGHRSSPPRSRVTGTWRGRIGTPCSSRRATSTPCASRCGGCSTTPRSGRASSPPGASGPSMFSMRRLAERYLELYARALVPTGRGSDGQ